MKKFQQGNTALGLLVLALWLAAVGGWVANVYKLVAPLVASGSEPVVFTGLMIARAVGVVLAPVGIVLGYF